MARKPLLEVKIEIKIRITKNRENFHIVMNLVESTTFRQLTYKDRKTYKYKS